MTAAGPFMTSLDVSAFQPFVANVITRRADSAAAAAAAAAARRAYEDLSAVLVPILTQDGVDALIVRALQLTKQQYPIDRDRRNPAETFRLWLERQDPAVVRRGAIAILSTFAALLAALIGEPLTTSCLHQAWSGRVPPSRPDVQRTLCSSVPYAARPAASPARHL
jgi:hypothetical protein